MKAKINILQEKITVFVLLFLCAAATLIFRVLHSLVIHSWSVVADVLISKKVTHVHCIIQFMRRFFRCQKIFACIRLMIISKCTLKIRLYKHFYYTQYRITTQWRVHRHSTLNWSCPLSVDEFLVSLNLHRIIIIINGEAVARCQGLFCIFVLLHYLVKLH